MQICNLDGTNFDKMPKTVKTAAKAIFHLNIKQGVKILTELDNSEQSQSMNYIIIQFLMI